MANVNQGGSATGTATLGEAELFAAAPLSASGTVVSTGTLNNTGTIIGTVTLLAGTGLVNDAGATITGYAYAPSGNTSGVTVTNLGVIANTATTFGYGVREFYTGSVTNGSVSDATASIAGFSGGIYLGGSLGAVVNYGTITGTGATGDNAVFVNRGSVANLGTAAVISGASAGVLVWYSGSVVNQGTIRSQGHSVLPWRTALMAFCGYAEKWSNASAGARPRRRMRVRAALRRAASTWGAAPVRVRP